MMGQGTMLFAMLLGPSDLLYCHSSADLDWQVGRLSVCLAGNCLCVRHARKHRMTLLEVKTQDFLG